MPCWKLVWTIAWALGCMADEEWTHHLVLDHENNFHMLWVPLNDSLVIELQVRTLGYVAIGFSPNGGMRGADIVMGWASDGDIKLRDSYASSNSVPVIDDSQDYTLLGGYENSTHTVIRFSRPWDTCDHQDLRLGPDTVRLIWAYHPEDPGSDTEISYHSLTRRGVRSVHLKEKPRSFIDEEDPDIKIWDLLAKNVRLPNDDHTHYWCTIFRAPFMDRKHHMLGFKPIFQSGHEGYLHHMVLYECHVPEDSDSWFAQHVNHPGAACYSPNMPPEWTFCLATNTWAWAVGSDGEILPDHVGMPIGEEYGGATYFMLEIHYDNPGMHDDLVDNSGIRIFYTDQLREHDTGLLLLGTEVNFLHWIPPLQDTFTTVGRCTAECTQQGFEPSGIKILNGVLHSHLASRGMRLRHIRDGQELPIVLQDNHYDFNFQASREPETEIAVLPGDELLLECDYTTKTRTAPTFGGLSTREEMCMAFMIYYPRQPLADCRSLPSLKTVMKALGIQAIYGKAFEKLMAFMQNINGDKDDGEATLQDLLHILAVETGQKPFFADVHSQTDLNQLNQPLTEEDLLNKPFYVVQTEAPQDLQQATNYRNLLPEMLMSIRIKSPKELHNVTMGEHFASMKWNSTKVSKFVENMLYFGNHNSLCLAHGRKPIIPYEETPYPTFEPRMDDSFSQCNQIRREPLRKEFRGADFMNSLLYTSDVTNLSPPVTLLGIFCIVAFINFLTMTT